MDFAPRLGVPVHGIIGYDLFKDFVVEVNYSGKYIRLNNPEDYRLKRCKKCEVLDLEFYNSKPYLNAEIDVNGVKMPVKLLIDSGGSDALWLFEDKERKIEPTENNYFEDFLGSGLSGSIYMVSVPKSIICILRVLFLRMLMWHIQILYLSIMLESLLNEVDQFQRNC